jgi:Flp pilus assembly protein TadG
MTRRSERGATLVLAVVGMLALIAMAGLAIDTAHVLLNKSRLQNALDAAALAGAKGLALGEPIGTASAPGTASGDASANFLLNVAQYPELQRANLSLTTQFSTTLNPFTPGAAGPYVRASIAGFTTQMSLVAVLGINSMNIAGSAVAGPSPALTTACAIVPVAMCSTTAAGPPLYGYTPNQVVGLNQTAGNAGTIGPGNYGLLALGGKGAINVETNLAGSYSSCASIGPGVNTEPGVAAGPVSDGINTRFGIYKDPGHLNAAAYPPDTINSTAHQTSPSLQGTGLSVTYNGQPATASNINFSYSNYTALQQAKTYDTQPLPSGTAAFDRRILAVPLADCTGLAAGSSPIAINGFACVFLLQQMGLGANASTIYGQIISGCDANGTVGPVGSAGAVGPYRIELYKSAGSADS